MAIKQVTKRRRKADQMLAGKPASDKPQLGLLTEELAAPELAGIRTLWRDAVAPGLTPQKLATTLKEAESGSHIPYLTLAEDMEERELHYAAVLGTRKRAICGVEPVVEAAGEDARSVEIADAVDDLIGQPVFGSMIEHITDALGKGYAVSEIMWETSAKQWMPYDYRDRDPRFFNFDMITRRELRLLTLEEPMFGEPLLPFKFITHIPRLKSGIPIRGGLAKPAAWAFCFKSYSLKDWVAFCEVYGMPIRVGKYGPMASADDRRALLGAVRNIGSDAAAIIPATMQIEFVEAAKGASSSIVFEKLCEYLDKQMSKLVLGQTMTTDHGSSGGLAQARVHENVRHDILVADCKSVEITLNRDIVRPFIDLNYGPQKAYPKVKLPVPKPEDLTALTDSVVKLIPLGLRVREAELREKFGLSEPDEGDAILSATGVSAFERNEHLEREQAEDEADAEVEMEPVKDTAELEDENEPDEPTKKPSKPGKKADKKSPKKAANRRKHADKMAAKKARNRARGHDHSHAHETDELDRIRDLALDGWQRQMAPVLQPIEALAKSCNSYDEFVAKLPAALSKMDTREFEATLTTAMAKAFGLGDAGTTAHKDQRT